MLDSRKFQSAMQLHGPVEQSYGRESVQLVSDLRDDKHNSILSGISNKVEALETDV